MRHVLEVKDIIKEKNKITIRYEYTGDWNKYLTGNEFFCKYEDNIESVPDSIAIIPFLANVLPISWVFNLDIKVDELDKVFYDSIPDIKEGYKNMYPMIKFGGNIYSNKIVANKHENTKSAVLFSGGVDAYCTLLRHIDEKPDIITIFGADIELSDTKGIQNVNKLNQEIADEIHIKYESIYSNFRKILNYHNLYKKISKIIAGEWWHEFQHGIGIIGLVSPLSYIKGYNKVYIASSYCVTQKGQYTCASDPTIDNQLKYSNTITSHDGYELNRQDKIEYICKIRKKLNISQIKLRVCWESAGGKNCCHCEKCYRTIMGIITEKENPNNYYFNFNDNNRKNMIEYLKKNLVYCTKNGNITNYKPIQDKFVKQYDVDNCPEDLIWFRDINIGSKNPTFYLLKKRIKNKIRRIIKRNNQ